MNLLRRFAALTLWLLAAVGIASGAVWGLTTAGVIKPLVVISGSMQPGIQVGDLVVDTKVPASQLKVGDVVSLPSSLTENLVTHRIRAIHPDGHGGYTVTLKGDANRFEDVLDYHVSGSVWQPQVQLPGAGAVLMRMTTPAVAVPLLVGLGALLAITWLVPAPARRENAQTDAAPASAVAHA